MLFPEFHGYLIASAGIVLTPTPLPSGEGTRAGGASCRLRRLSFSLSFQPFVVLHKKKGSGQSASLQIFKIPESKFLHQDVLVGLIADGVAGVGGSVEE